MPKIASLKKSLALSFAFFMVVVPLSSTTFADDPATPPPCVAPAQSTYPAGVHWPTGADAGTFTYQCTGTYAGEWTNAHYVYNPATSSRAPIDPVVYTYNSTTGLWDTTQWNYSPSTGNFSPVTVSVSTPPAGATTVGGPQPVIPASSDPGTGTVTANAISPDNTNNSGSNGSTGTTLDGSNNLGVNNTTGVTMTNGVLSFAGSGNAVVGGNTQGGNANTGNATANAIISNLLQSTSNVLNNPNITTFTANINGDVNGDLLLDPTQLSTMQPANDTSNLDNKVTVNNSTDTSINNDINLNAKTGDAAVTGNTQGGDATSGNASAVADIVNTLNSVVNAGQSFIGVININGNLNGDILLPPNFVDTLLSSNVPRYSVNTSKINNTSTINNANNDSITNAVNATAASGDATVADNTAGGNATTGAATTNLTVFNLTGSSVVASNDIMVFVNVLGSWYGMILNAPAGTTAASLGGGVTSNTVNNDATLNNTNNASITNNVNANSQSGDASVTDNTQGGDAKTGDATSSVNIMNMINDDLSLNGWFGLLFINVYGSWNGSFGVNTSAGDPLAAPAAGDNGTTTTPQVFKFVPKAGNYTSTGTVYKSDGTTVNTDSDTGTNAAVLAAKTVKSSLSSSTPQLASGHSSYLLPVVGVSLAFVILLAGERKRFMPRNNQ